jgi:hypothetical protein
VEERVEIGDGCGDMTTSERERNRNKGILTRVRSGRRVRDADDWRNIGDELRQN